MTKADLVEKVAKEAEMTKKDAEQLVEIVFDSIIGSLNEGENFFFKFSESDMKVKFLCVKLESKCKNYFTYFLSLM